MTSDYMKELRKCFQHGSRIDNYGKLRSYVDDKALWENSIKWSYKPEVEEFVRD